MSERENQQGDPETAVCHVCDRHFDSQEALSRHLMDEHPGELLPADRPEVTPEEPEHDGKTTGPPPKAGAPLRVSLDHVYRSTARFSCAFVIFERPRMFFRLASS